MKDLANAYRAARRPRNSSEHVPAALALPRARANLAALDAAKAARDAALVALSAARALALPRARANLAALVAARAEASKAEAAFTQAWRRTYPTREGHGNSPALGAPFAISPGSQARAQWCESPEPALRLRGLAHLLLPHCNTLGFYVDAHQDETATGAVYQLAPRNGCARYVPGIPDPCNADSTGHGPAMLFFGEIYTADDRSEDAADEAARECAARAMRLAELYAERQREHDAAYRAGQRAGEAKAAAVEAAAKLRALLRERREIRRTLPADRWPSMCAALTERARDLWESIHDARRSARDFANGDGESGAHWWTGDEELRRSFNDGLADA